ncbi:GLPGLI family protein [Pedobacter sp. N36a]|uniref:GLPGLI family protein n=1 Tax=Pedobacter sp. N36a TaxID=2767996 RepID=UPI001656E04B|nr:GLPGLI family protein [Pedobacter sp. N36a]MBC8988329.1 GLPGLI family protein [Pedobacter sp. N36a]
MNKRALLLFVLFLSATCLRAQQPETVIAKAFYKFSHIRDTTNLNKVSEDNMVLMLGPTSSVYKSFNRMISDSVMRANIDKVKTGTPPPGLGKYGSGTEVYLYTASKKAQQTDAMVENYLYDIQYPEINWQITADTTTISGIKCQKATGTWKGRTYEAWFSPEIPFHSGPWKLNGLPGLIISASDTKKQVRFDFAGFQKYNGAPIEISAAKQIVKTTEPEYKKLREAFLENPTAFMKTVMPEIQSITLSTPYVRKPAINNPIELEKK